MAEADQSFPHTRRRVLARGGWSSGAGIAFSFCGWSVLDILALDRQNYSRNFADHLRHRVCSTNARSRPKLRYTTRHPYSQPESESRLLFRSSPKCKVMVIGLDCADPELVFGPWLNDLPNIQRVLGAGVHGKLRSITPPITVPAWMCMMTSRDPGELGVYGFRNRSEYGYDKLSLANSGSIHEETVWDILSREGKDSIIIGVP